jgi:hypothetical protein
MTQSFGVAVFGMGLESDAKLSAKVGSLRNF